MPFKKDGNLVMDLTFNHEEKKMKFLKSLFIWGSPLEQVTLFMKLIKHYQVRV